MTAGKLAIKVALMASDVKWNALNSNAQTLRAHVCGVVSNIAVVPSSAANDIINPVSRTLSSQYTLSHAFSHHALRHPQQTTKARKKRRPKPIMLIPFYTRNINQ